MDDLKPFTTSDTPLAAYLHFKQHRVIGMRQDPNDMKRQVYVFVELPETQKLVSDFYDSDTGHDFQQYYKSVRVMFGVLRENINK